MGGKLLIGIKSAYVNSVSVKGCESECFRIDSGGRQVCIMSPLLFNVYMDSVMNELKMGIWEEWSEISRGGKRVDIAWHLVCR